MVIDEVYNGVGFKKQNLIHEFFIFRFCTPIFCGFNVQLNVFFSQKLNLDIQLFEKKNFVKKNKEIPAFGK